MLEKRFHIKEATSREKVLGNIRNALMQTIDNPISESNTDTIMLENTDEDLAIRFATAFNAAGGKFVYCSDLDEFLQLFYKLMQQKQDCKVVLKEPVLKDLLTDAQIPYLQKETPEEYIFLTTCEALIANTAGLVFKQGQLECRNTDIIAVAAYNSQLSWSLTEALQKIINTNSGNVRGLHILNGNTMTSDLFSEGHTLSRYYLFFIDN